MRTLGVDVSHWEGSIDWKLAAPTIGFAYYKCTDGVRFVDDQFASNRQGCNAAGLAHAPYHYYQPLLDPIAQADHFIRTAGKGYGRYIVDLEEPERLEGITSKLQLFLERVQQLTAIKPAIYTSAGYWNEFIHPKSAWSKEYDLLVAHYTLAHSPLLPIGWTTWRIWQFTDYWFFPGCNSAADGNWFNGNAEECKAWFGNSTVAEARQPEEGSIRLHLLPSLRSLFDGLNIRQSPDMKARITGKLEKGEMVEGKR